MTTMNDNNAYIVQCTQDNFEDAKCMVQMYCRIINIDVKNYCIKTFSLDSLMKRRLDDIGVSFWEEHECISTKAAFTRGL